MPKTKEMVCNVLEPLRPFLVQIESVQLDPVNARAHPVRNIDTIKYSLENYTQRVPIVVNGRTGIIEKGNGMWQAAMELGWTHIAVVHVDDEAEMAAAFSLMDNKSGELSEWDLPALKDSLELLDTGAFDMNLTGFTEEEIADLMTQFYTPGEGKTPDDQVPEDAPAVTNLGDLFALGQHRLMCGDATSSPTVARLMAGVRAQMVFTDPPYGMKYEGTPGQPKKKMMLGDEDDAVLPGAFRTIHRHCMGSWYICYHRTLIWRALKALLAEKMEFHNIIIWRKNSINLSASDYKSLYEPVIHGWATDYDPVFYGWEGVHCFYGRRGEQDVWEIPSVWDINKTKKNELHPTQKPVQLVERAVNNSSLLNDVVLDLFGGSGTTMIACEKLGRRCFMLELDPRFCDVIIKRWQDYTGKQAERMEVFK